MTKRIIAIILCVAALIGISSCRRRIGNPTVDGGTVWENSGADISENEDANGAYNLNYNVADALAAHAEGVDMSQVDLAQGIIAELDRYPEYSDNKEINYIIKLRSVYKCVIGFYYMNSTYDQLDSMIKEYDNAYAELSNDSKIYYTRINSNLFVSAARQFEAYGKSVTNS